MGNIFFAHSGGVTATVNTTLSGVIDRYFQYNNEFEKLLIGSNGILGALKEELIDISQYDKNALNTIFSTPGSTFGSCRYKLFLS